MVPSSMSSSALPPTARSTQWRSATPVRPVASGPTFPTHLFWPKPPSYSRACELYELVEFNVLRTYVESDNKATILEFPKKTMRKGTSSKTVAKRMTGAQKLSLLSLSLSQTLSAGPALGTAQNRKPAPVRRRRLCPPRCCPPAKLLTSLCGTSRLGRLAHRRVGALPPERGDRPE